MGRLGVDLMQLIIAPTVAWKIAPDHAMGIAPLFAYQRFRIQGAQLFTQLSQAPANVTNKDYDNSTGWGVALRLHGPLARASSIGRDVHVEDEHGQVRQVQGALRRGRRLRHARALHARRGLPPDRRAGCVAIDYKRIKYSGSPPSATRAPTRRRSAPPNGPGFGWQDVDVWKFGVQYQASPKLTVRAGYGKSDNPILVARRDVQHPRPGRGAGPLHARLHLRARQGVGDHVAPTCTPSATR